MSQPQVPRQSLDGDGDGGVSGTSSFFAGKRRRLASRACSECSRDFGETWGRGVSCGMIVGRDMRLLREHVIMGSVVGACVCVDESKIGRFRELGLS